MVLKKIRELKFSNLFAWIDKTINTSNLKPPASVLISKIECEVKHTKADRIIKTVKSHL